MAKAASAQNASARKLRRAGALDNLESSCHHQHRHHRVMLRSTRLSLLKRQREPPARRAITISNIFRQ